MKKKLGKLERTVHLTLLISKKLWGVCGQGQQTTESILSQMPRLEIQTQVDSGFARPLLTLGEDPSCLSQSLVALGILGWWFHHSNLCPHLHMASPAMPLPNTRGSLKSPS